MEFYNKFYKVLYALHLQHLFFSFSFSFLFLFAILTLFSFSSSSIIVFLVQYFIPSNNFILFFNFHLIFFRFKKKIHYIFLNSIVSLHSTFHLLPPFLFHLNFHINFFLITSFTPLSPIFSKLSTTKRSILSLFLQFCFSFG